jgi:hypothetical protein
VKKILLSTYLLLCFPFGLLAQNQDGLIRIKGVLKDSASTKSLAYVLVGVRESDKKDLIKTVYTKEDGSFEITGLQGQGYELVISSLGFKSKIIPLQQFPATNAEVDIGEVGLAIAVSLLQEVEVTAGKKLVKQDIDKLTYDVEADPESQTAIVLDILRKVPMVTVDAEDNIKLKGSGNFKVLVNGRASSMFERNPKEVFKSMPASSIKSIEVITNPSAKYDGEGLGGIINIITHRRSPGGYNGSVNLGLIQPKGYNGSSYLTAKAGKFGITNYFGTGFYTTPTTASNLFRNDVERKTRLSQQGITNHQGDYRYHSLEGSFELDSLNLFTAYMYMNGGSYDSYLQQNVRNEKTTGLLLQDYIRIDDSFSKWNNYDLGADYQRGFHNHKERLLTFSYRFGNYTNNYNSDFTFEPVFNFRQPKGLTGNTGNATEETWQVDYVQPIRKQTLELGVKSIHRSNTSAYKYLSYDTKESQYLLDPALSNSLNYDQEIAAAYSSLTIRLNKWSGKLGARWENTKVNANFHTSDAVVDQGYFNFLPSAYLFRQLTEESRVKLSYNQRIERPGLRYINPYVNVIDPKNIFYGNPELEAAISHFIDVEFSADIKESFVTASMYYNFTNQVIQQFTILGPDDITRTTYGNIGENRRFGFNFYGNFPITKKLTLNINTNATYQWWNSIVGGKLVETEGPAGNATGNLSYNFGKNWRFNANFSYNSRLILVQGRSSGYINNSASVSKEFLRSRKASITFSASNPFQRERFVYSQLNDPVFTQRQEFFYIVRRFNASFNYRFGKLKEDIARKKRGIYNDDLKNGE